MKYELQKIGVNDDGKLIDGPGHQGSKIGSGPFGWVKQWGFGLSAYLFDFFDPSLRPIVLEDMAKIWDTFSKYPAADTKEYTDPFNKLVVIPEGIDEVSRAKLEAGRLAHDQAILTPVYKISVNAVQLNQGMKENKWYLDKSTSDNARAFIRSYDMNVDGRLSARELLLGSIYHNKAILGSDECKLCYEELTDKIDGIFQYIDCNNDGSIGAEEMWEHLPKLRRDTTKWNFYTLASKATIRTAVVNDFILKNGFSTSGQLNKVEFRLGILLGFWDRQTDDFGVIQDDKRNMKSLRWEDDEIIDRGAMLYIKGRAAAQANAEQQRQQAIYAKNQAAKPEIQITMEQKQAGHR